jgi:hypothetical protein
MPGTNMDNAQHTAKAVAEQQRSVSLHALSLPATVLFATSLTLQVLFSREISCVSSAATQQSAPKIIPLCNNCLL